MVKEYKDYQMMYVRFDESERPICPECVQKGHDVLQVRASWEGDCKNTFVYTVGEWKGQRSQCCCYCDEHKSRE